MSNRDWNRFIYPSHYPELNDPRSVPVRPSLINPERRRTEMLDTRDRELERFLGIDRVGASGGNSSVTVVVATPESRNPEDADFVTTGTDDQDTIQAAIDALPTPAAYGGSPAGTIVLREGLYNITGSLTGDLTFVRFRGEFLPILLLSGTGYTFAPGGYWYDMFISAQGATSIVVLEEGNLFNCVVLGSTGSPALLNCSAVILSSVVGLETAIEGDDGSICTIRDSIISGETAFDGTGGGFCAADNTSFTGSVKAGVLAILFQSCRFDSVVGMTVAQVELDSSYAAGGFNRAGIYDSIFETLIEDLPSFLSTGSDAIGDRFRLVNNTFGIVEDSHAIILDDAVSIQVSHNQIDGCTSSDATVYQAVRVTGTSTNCHVTHNDICLFDSDQDGILLDTATTDNIACFNVFQGSGVYITDNGTGNTITCPGGV